MLPDTLAAPRAELLWDRWGIPHVYAPDAATAIQAFGWAQMRSHGDLLLRLYGQARGRAAEYWGERYFDSDAWVWTNGIPARSAEWLAQQYPQEQSVLDAFVAGINAWAELHPDSLAPDVRQVLPVRPADVLAHLQRVLHFTFVANPAAVAGIGRAWQGSGSNAWAIAPARSASRHALLLANPHLPWGDLFTWFEAQLDAPDLKAYGATLVGFPLPAIAFNDSLGWTFTTSPLDGADLYQLELRGNGYVVDGRYEPFREEQERLSIRGEDGGLTGRTLRIRRSVHGPVVADNPRYALALRVAGLDAPHLIGQQLDMLRAHDLREFETALSRLQLPLFQVTYADARGHIMSVYQGRVPVRPAGDSLSWSGIVPGYTLATLWTDTYQYWQLPRAVDPPTGWLQNANEPPWTMTLPPPLDYRGYPASLAPPPALSFRAQHSARMLAEDSLITFDEFVAYKHSTRVELADHILEDLVQAARPWGGGEAGAAAAVLERWDRQERAGRRGAVLFQAFADLLRGASWPGGSPFDVPWTIRAPLATPDGLSDPRAAAGLLERAAAALRARFGALDVAWGDVYRLRRDTLDFPASGGPAADVFRVFSFEAADDTHYRATGGDSWVAAVEFGAPVRARAVLSYGNASRPGSPHRTDQLPLVAAQQLRDVWLTRAEVEANLRDRERFR
ncbi:MAG: acylase [Gemmatimonadetes bacterium]|nr:acylase [Gemmatimonadota bacterium]